jgi:endonuclease III
LNATDSHESDGPEVIADQGIRAERAWAIPRELQLRLGGFSPEFIASNPEAIRTAFAAAPKLHRFINQVADWTIAAAGIVIETYHGDAAEIWAGESTAAELRQRFDDFPGIGQKKAAMAVEILERSLGVKVSDLSGSDVAIDVHLRRVFLRTGIAERDELNHMVAEARALHPERPGQLDNPTWDIGRRWCTAKNPDCANCPLVAVCPRLIERGNAVRGI